MLKSKVLSHHFYLPYTGPKNFQQYFSVEPENKFFYGSKKTFLSVEKKNNVVEENL